MKLSDNIAERMLTLHIGQWFVFSLNILFSSDVKMTLVKVPLQQRDLLLKMNISSNSCKFITSMNEFGPASACVAKAWKSKIIL